MIFFTFTKFLRREYLQFIFKNFQLLNIVCIDEIFIFHKKNSHSKYVFHL